MKNFEKYFENINLDIRKNIEKSLRFSDQKNTPDVLSFIADCIINLDDSLKKGFSRKDVENNDYFISNMKLIFGKSLSSNEIDKFISQPLALLTYSKILCRSKCKNKIGFIYSIQNEDLLSHISINDKNSFHFLYFYYKKFFLDSGFRYFNEFIKHNNSDAYIILREKFISFMIAYTNIGSKGTKNPEIEIGRIFTKIINIYACYHCTKGSLSGHYSKTIITYSELMYNRLNFRDIHNKKEKNISRKEHEKNKYVNKSTIDEYLENLMRRAMKRIKKLHPYSEINDNLYGITDVVHHIFSKSEYPELKSYLENLIALTSGQHTSKAHPNHNTQIIDKEYQLLCLHSKCETVFNDLDHYSIPNFIYVINQGLQLDKENMLPDNLDKDKIKEKLRELYSFVY